MAEQELQIHPEVDEDVIEISTHIAMDNPIAAKAVEFAEKCNPADLAHVRFT